MVRNNKNIKGLNIFDNFFSHIVYADNTTFFLQNKELIEELKETFTLFSSFLSLKPNISKCEICGLGSLKGVGMAVCGMQSVDLTRDGMKILGIYFLCSINLTNEKKNMVKLWPVFMVL